MADAVRAWTARVPGVQARYRLELRESETRSGSRRTTAVPTSVEFRRSGRIAEPDSSGLHTGGLRPQRSPRSRVGAAVAHAFGMINFPTIDVLPTGTVAIASPIVVIGTPALIALGFALAVLVGVVCVARLLRRQRRTVGARRVPAATLTLPYTASKGEC